MPAKGRDLLLFFLIILIVVLSSLTTYFFAKSKTLSQTSTIPSEELSQFNNVTPSSTTPTTSTTVSGFTSRLSQPKQLHSVAKGETLHTIALNYDLSYTALASANGLQEPYTIKEGQILVIPSLDDKTKKLLVEFVLTTKASEIQSKVQNGGEAYYLDPQQAAAAQAQGVFGLSFDQTYTVKSQESNKVVLGAKNTFGEMEIELNQPLTRGEKGAWAITKITQISK